MMNHQVRRSVDFKSFLFFVLVTLFGAAHAQDAELARKKCVEFGFKDKTPSHETCMDQFLQATGAVKTPAQPSMAAPPISAAQLEEKFWDATMAVGNKEAFEAYIENYPRGRYAGLARANITRIDGAAAMQQRALVEAADKLTTERTALEAEQKLARERAGPQPVMAASVAAAPASATSASTSPLPVSNDDDIAWMWPTDGPVLAGFDEVKMKGLDIGGTAGSPILAAADGRAVYVGAGLRGYGNLIILKHNNTYLTAYAHNQTLLVKEDQQVRKGQKIAEMGSSDADRVKLSFELRRHGKPVDPSKYLPPR